MGVGVGVGVGVLTIRALVGMGRSCDVLTVKQSLGCKPLDVIVDQGVEDPGSLPLGPNELGKTQLCQVLGNSSRVGTHMLGEIVHCVAAVQQRPHDPKSGGIG